jgi:hypothetical protein
MEEQFWKVKEYLIDLNCDIIQEDSKEGVFVIHNEEEGISNMVIAVVPPILIIEQFLFRPSAKNFEMYASLLKKNREIVHGAFVIDESGNCVLFRDTLQIDNLDLNELEGTLNSLGLLLSEYSQDLIRFSNQ